MYGSGAGARVAALRGGRLLRAVRMSYNKDLAGAEGDQLRGMRKTH